MIPTRKRIIFVLPGFPFVPVGGYKLVFQYANEILRQGLGNVSVHIWFSYAFYTGKNTKRSALRVLCSHLAHEIALFKSFGKESRRPRVAWFDLDSRVQVRSFYGTPSCDIRPTDTLIATSCETAPWVSERQKRDGCNGVYFIQAFEDWSASASYVRYTWKLGLKLVVISPWLQAEVAAIGAHADMVANGIDPDEFPAGPSLTDRPLQVLSLASENPSKRLDLVEAVYSRLAVAHSDWRLVSFGVGQRPSKLPASSEYVQKPSVDSLSRMYRESRVYMCTSDHEGWGLPPAEALASGTAVVSTNVAGVRSYAEGGAEFVPPGDEDALVRAVEKSMAAGVRVQQMTAVGQVNVRARTTAVAALEFFEAIMR